MRLSDTPRVLAHHRRVRTARRFVVVALLGCVGCRFDSTGSETGGSGLEPAWGTDDESADGTDESDHDASADATTADTSGPVAEGGESTSAADEGSSPEDSCPRLRVDVSPGRALNVRPSPSTSGDPLFELPNHAIVDHVDDVQGEWIDGSDVWFEIASDQFAVTGFVFSHYAVCTDEYPPVLHAPDGYWLPLECNTSATISQGNDGDFTHQGNAFWAFDFSLGLGTPLVAMADGIVIHRYANTLPGDPCYDGGGENCYEHANLVVLLHGDGFASIYKHLSNVLVSDGEFVPRGAVVGLSGSSGYSTGPHAHVMRQEDCGQANCQSVPLEFVDIGVPVTGDDVSSNNCP